MGGWLLSTPPVFPSQPYPVFVICANSVSQFARPFCQQNPPDPLIFVLLLESLLGYRFFFFFFLFFSLSLLCAVQSCPTFVLATVQHASKANRLLASSRIARRFGFFYPSSPSHPSAFHSRSFMVDIDGRGYPVGKDGREGIFFVLSLPSYPTPLVV